MNNKRYFLKTYQQQPHYCIICDTGITQEEYEAKALCLRCQDDLYNDEVYEEESNEE